VAPAADAVGEVVLVQLRVEVAIFGRDQFRLVEADERFGFGAALRTYVFDIACTSPSP
jgi:hypothetical protein